VQTAFFKKLEILENYQALPTCKQCAAAEQHNISRVCLRNILFNEIALRSEALLLLLEGGGAAKATPWQGPGSGRRV